MERLGLYLEFIRLRIRIQTQFRGQFLLVAFSKIVGFGADFATLYIMVNRFENLGGWSAPEVLSLCALSQLAYAFGACMGFHTSGAMDNIARNGEMDALLTRPVSPLLYLMAKNFTTGYVGNITIAIICLVIGLGSAAVPITFYSVFMMVLTVVGGAMISGSMMLLTSIPSIYMVNVSLRGLFFFRLRDFTLYPITIFSPVIRIIFTVVLPYAFIAFYPAQAVFGKTPLYHPVLQYLSPLIGLFLCFLVTRYFRYAIGKYQGSGT